MRRERFVPADAVPEYGAAADRNQPVLAARLFLHSRPPVSPDVDAGKALDPPMEIEIRGDQRRQPEQPRDQHGRPSQRRGVCGIGSTEQIGRTTIGRVWFGVARIITRLNIGGPAIQAAMLSDRMRERGFETLLIHGRLAAGEGDMSYLLDGRQVQASYLPSLVRSVSPLADARAVAGILRQLRAFQPQIVHTHTAKAGTVGRTAAMAYNRSAATRARTVHTYHGHSLEGYFRYAGAFISIERLLARRTDRLIAISPRIAADLRDRYHIGRPAQWAVVPLGFDLAPLAAIDDASRAEARRALGFDPATPVVTIVGRLTAIKQHELFLRVARDVHAQQPSTVFADRRRRRSPRGTGGAGPPVRPRGPCAISRLAQGSRHGVWRDGRVRAHLPQRRHAGRRDRGARRGSPCREHGRRRRARCHQRSGPRRRGARQRRRRA